MSEASNGSGPGTLPPTPLFYSILAAFIGIALYNAIEINVQVFSVFKKWSGLYFWSMLIASWGCVLLSVGNIALKLFTPGISMGVTGTFILFGWWMVVLGQACVLYSRLHLVVRSRAIMRFVPIMIGLIFVGLCVPTSVATYGMMSDKSSHWLPIFNYIERIQLCFIEVEELVISALYIWATRIILRPSFNIRTKRVMWSLIYVNIFIVGLDVVMIAMEFANYYDLEAALKPMLYSIKLKVEFAVLNQLMAIAKTGLAASGYKDYNTADPDAFNDKSTAKGLWSLQSDSKWIPSFGHGYRHRKHGLTSSDQDSNVVKTDNDVNVTSDQTREASQAYPGTAGVSKEKRQPRGDGPGSRSAVAGRGPKARNNAEPQEGQRNDTEEEPNASWLELENLEKSRSRSRGDGDNRAASTTEIINGERVINRMGLTLEEAQAESKRRQACGEPSLDLNPWDDIIRSSTKTGSGIDPYKRSSSTGESRDGAKGSGDQRQRQRPWQHVDKPGPGEHARWEMSGGDDNVNVNVEGGGGIEGGGFGANAGNRPGLLSGGRRRESVTEFGTGGALDEVADDEVGLTLFGHDDEDENEQGDKP